MENLGREPGFFLETQGGNLTPKYRYINEKSYGRAGGRRPAAGVLPTAVSDSTGTVTAKPPRPGHAARLELVLLRASPAGGE